MSHSLFSLPPVDQLQLSEAELEGLAGSPQHKLQIEWLRSNNWAYALTRSGRPVVGRLYANLRLANVDVATIAPTAPAEWTPDTSAIQ